MSSAQGTLTTCSRGHQFYKRIDCPVCPQCWPGRYQEIKSDFPKLSAPALRALHNAGITSLAGLTKYSEKEILALHGVGPSALPLLRSALDAKGLRFKET